MDIKKILNTLKYVKFKQIYYRLYYFIRNKFFKWDYNKKLENSIEPLVWTDFILYSNSFIGSNGFTFLNIIKEFSDKIDWNYPKYGKLWTYNLNYFDFLNQKDIAVEQGVLLIKNFIENDHLLKDGKEPYPISLRGINWIKFISRNKILNESINQTLYNHYQILIHNLEYHLLGNHLLENSYSLFFGAYYFKDEIFYKKAKNILIGELNEQVLDDGAHFELSPMYHQILLYRLLDCINLIQLNNWKQDELFSFLKEKAIKMLSWLQTITYKNGNIPMVNDSAYGIAPSSKEIFNYAKSIDLKWQLIKLSDSGYRTFKEKNYELFVDVGNIGPTYQPGHAHSDTFSFELYVKNKPIIVDLGTSTYEKNKLRQLERETASHNTVKIGKKEQSQVWGGFRVANRAIISNFNERKKEVQATHNGYRSLNIFHTRKFKVENTSIIINDSFSRKINEVQIAFFHFHPDIKNIKIFENKVRLLDEKISMFFCENIKKIEIEYYNYAIGFNKTSQAKKIMVYFNSSLTTQIDL
ncbi:heparinase II/III domain-containing protein [Thalassobellus citreus]|uniref:heparinase II/III domain-containing protein n=1 Tax=Thalassobellus citreus TaxID=3367752 RepID=UPI0037AD0A5D